MALAPELELRTEKSGSDGGGVGDVGGGEKNGSDGGGQSTFFSVLSSNSHRFVSLWLSYLLRPPPADRHLRRRQRHHHHFHLSQL
ncbi:hypothetical protein Q3G72_004740 [Acer saccharum]|nr:hypothetical protein Q3G72_004740 [Acer saccharum]